MKKHIFFLLPSLSLFALLVISACSSSTEPTNRSSTCSTVFSGPQEVRVFTTDNPADFKPVSLAGASVEITPDQGSGQYYIGLLIGGKQVFTVVDTGSSNIIIDGNDFAADPSKFSGEGFSVNYVSGGAAVAKYNDKVSLACGDNEVDYSVGIIKQNSGNIPSILGLAYPSIAQPSGAGAIVPFLDQVVAKNNGAIIDLFGMALCGHKTGTAIAIGGPLPNIKQEDLTYVPVIAKKWYVVDARSMQVLDWALVNGQWQPKTGAITKLGDFQAYPASGAGIATIVDSGATMNAFPAAIYNPALAVLRAASARNGLGIPDDYWDAVPGEPNYSRTIPHSTIEKLPKFQIVIRGETDQLVNLDLLPDTYLKRLKTDGSVDERTSSFRKGGGLNILGQAFMEGYYVEFDRTNKGNRIGFASNAAFCKEP